jgi:hypothetical protein
MHSNGNRWLTTQETATQLNTTSSEVTRLLSLGPFQNEAEGPSSSRQIAVVGLTRVRLKGRKTPHDRARAQGSAPQARLRSAVMRNAPFC